MAEHKSALRTIYHVIDGAVSMHLVDARHALQFRDQWRDKPDFTAEEKRAYLQKQIDEAREKADLSGEKADEVRAAKVERENTRRMEKLGAADTPRPESVVVIEDNWQNFPPLKRINLATKLGAERKGLTAAAADDVIQAEVDRRQEEIENPAQPEPASEDSSK